MPLQPAYTWSETDTSIKITIENVPIKDQGQLFCSDRLVKLNAPPYLLLLDLKHAVDDDRSAATITKGRKAVIKLTKAEPGPWHKLTADGDAAALRRQREESVQRAHRKVLAAQQQRQARKQAEERAAIDLQIQQQKAQRDQLEALKQQELQQERQGLQDWQEQLEQGDESDYEDDTLEGAHAQASDGGEQAAAAHSAPDSSTQEVYHGKGWWPSKETHSAQADSSSSSSSSSSNSNSNSSSADTGVGSEPECISLGRGCTSSKGEDGLRQLVAAPAAAACKDMLLDAPAQGTADAAEPLLSASSTRRLSDTRSGSAAAPQAHPAAGRPGSSKPIKPVAPVRSRAEPVQVTFTQLQTPHLPAREQREVEIKQIKKAAGKADSMDVADRQPAFLKDKGDAFAAQGNYRGAINAYTKALELDPNQAALWANRAAAHLALGQAEECVQDCTTAIRLVEQATAALQAAPGAATERELQAAMLGASAAAVQPPGGAAAAAAQQSAGPEAAAASAEAHGVGSSNGGSAVCSEGCTAASPPPSPGGSAQGGQKADGRTAAASADKVVAAEAGSTSSCDDAALPLQQQQQDSGMAAKLKQLLVKLLARRAAAYVELQQQQLLQQAAEDLEHALRLDPDNAALKADALEVSLALSPTSSSKPAQLKEVGVARFRAGDLQAAAEAFSALAELLQQQGQQQQQPGSNSQQACTYAQEAAEQPCQQQQQLLLAGALSNRAACWLGLNRHEECVADCWAAWEALWPGTTSSSPAATADGTANECGTPDAGVFSSSSSEDVVRRLQRNQPEQLLALAGAAAVQSAARSMARLAAACVCLKSVAAAEAAFNWAAACWRLLGEQGRVAAILADKQKLCASGPAAAAAAAASDNGGSA